MGTGKMLMAAMMWLASMAAAAQTENGFQAFDVMYNFDTNGFRFYNMPLVLCSGDKKENNAMTIGWGTIGTLWGMARPVATVYVAEKRYTKQLMDRHRYFTLMYFSDDHVNEYLGSRSGRDGDKAKALGLTVAYTKNGTPYYKEAEMVMECETMYAAPFEESGFRNDVPKNLYKNFAAGIHTQYIGQVVGAWKKEK